MKLLTVAIFYGFIVSCSQQVKLEKKDDVKPVIMDGTISDEGSWPWMTYISATDRQYVYSCGGIVTTKYWVLTAAHCLFYDDRWHRKIQPRKINVLIGTVDIQRSRYSHSTGISEYIIHPEFSLSKTKTKDNDIALLKMIKSVPDELFEPIMIGPPDIPKLGDICMSMGWGCQIYDSDKGTDRLHEVILPILPLQNCSKVFLELVYGNMSTKLCAGYFQRKRGICMGDSGGPLICRAQQQWVLSGITSYTKKNLPAVFTKVSSYKNWINKIILSDLEDYHYRLKVEGREDFIPRYFQYKSDDRPYNSVNFVPASNISTTTGESKVCENNLLNTSKVDRSLSKMLRRYTKMGCKKRFNRRAMRLFYKHL